MLNIDTSSEFGERAIRHLEDDQVVWLTTVTADGVPQPSPVWFLWDGETAIIYSQPNTPKVRNIAANTNVTLNFNSTEHGGDVIILTGKATVDAGAPSAADNPEYLGKYGDGIESISMTPASFAASYSVPVRVHPEKIRGH